MQLASFNWNGKIKKHGTCSVRQFTVQSEIYIMSMQPFCRIDRCLEGINELRHTCVPVERPFSSLLLWLNIFWIVLQFFHLGFHQSFPAKPWFMFLLKRIWRWSKTFAPPYFFLPLKVWLCEEILHSPSFRKAAWNRSKSKLSMRELELFLFIAATTIWPINFCNFPYSGSCRGVLEKSSIEHTPDFDWTVTWFPSFTGKK